MAGFGLRRGELNKEDFYDSPDYCCNTRVLRLLNWVACNGVEESRVVRILHVPSEHCVFL